MFDRLRRRLSGGDAAPVAPPPDPAAAEELRGRILEWVGPGFRDRADARELALDAAHDEHPGLSDEQVGALVDEVWAARLAEQASWPARTDADRVAEAFAALEARGVVARMAFTCCTTCGFAEIGDERPRDRPSTGFVFFHDQDAERLVDPDALLYLAFGGWSDSSSPADRTEADRRTGELVRDTLLEHGLDVGWDGDPRDRITVRGLDWRRRLPA